MPTAHVGETRLPKNFKRYSKQFSLLEIDCEPGNVPGKARLEACAAAAPDGFVFSLVVPSRVASLEPGADFDKALRAAQNVARVLKPKWWVVRTPADVRPTRRSRESLGALAARLKESGARVAWEPRGVWDDASAGAAADQLGVTLVQDIAREAPRGGAVLYSRLLALGKGARIGLSLADLIAERMRAYEESFVVVEGQGAREIQQALGLASQDEDAFGIGELALGATAAAGGAVTFADAMGVRRASAAGGARTAPIEEDDDEDADLDDDEDAADDDELDDEDDFGEDEDGNDLDDEDDLDEDEPEDDEEES